MGERGTVVEKQTILCFLSSSVGRRGITPDSQIALPSTVLRGFVDVFLSLHRSGMEGHETYN